MAKDTGESHVLDVEVAERLLNAFGRLWELSDDGWEMRGGVLRPKSKNTKKKK